MSIEDAIRQLDFPDGTDISQAASKSTEVVNLYMHAVRANHSLDSMEQENKILSVIYKRFFDYADSWAITTRRRFEDQKDHDNAPALKKSANEAVKDIQKNIIRFAKIYMHIGRCVGIISEQISEHERAVGATEKFQWTSDTGELLKRYQKEHQKLKDYGQRLADGLETIKEADDLYADLSKAAKKMLGEKPADDILRSVRSNLRTKNYDMARKSLERFDQAKKKFSLSKKSADSDAANLKKTGETYIWMIENADDLLVNHEGKLFLSGTEINVAIQAQEKEIKQKENFIHKYHGPYMNDQRKKLRKLRDKLLVFGSLEGLTTLYMKLIRGLSEPMNDIKDVRTFESEVIEHINYILKGQFQEIENIEKRTDENIAEFFESVKKFEAFMAEQDEQVA